MPTPDSIVRFEIRRSATKGLNGQGQEILTGTITDVNLFVPPNQLCPAPNPNSERCYDDNLPVPLGGALWYSIKGIQASGATFNENIVGVERNQVPGISTHAERLGGTSYIDVSTVNSLLVSGTSLFVAGKFTNTINFFGQSATAAAANDAYITKINASRVPQWPTIPRISGTNNLVVSQICIDTTGDIYICGYHQSALTFPGQSQIPPPHAGFNSMFLAKFLGSNGTFVWGKVWGSTGEVRGLGLCIDSTGSLIIAARFTGEITLPGLSPITSGGGTEGLMIKVNASNGLPIWGFQIGGNASDTLESVAPVSTGGVIAIGTFSSDTVNFGGITKTRIGPQDGFIAKYLVSGGSAPTLSWVNSYGNTGGTGLFFTRVTVGGVSNQIAFCGAMRGLLSVGGSVLNAPDATGILTAKYDSSGNHIWSRCDGGAGSSNNDSGSDVAIGSTGIVYVAAKLRSGWDFGNGNLTWNPLTVDPCSLKFAAANGSAIWSNRYTSGVVGAGTDGDFGLAVALNETQGKVFFGGLYTDLISFPTFGPLQAPPGAIEGFVDEIVI